MYYKVTAKCGHVGRKNYIIKNFFIKADSAKDAANKIRWTPRVKHHHKDAIRMVKEITYQEYIIGKKIMQNDKYFQVKNSTEQRICGCIKQEDVYPEEVEKKLKKSRILRRLRDEAREREWKKWNNKELLND